MAEEMVLETCRYDGCRSKYYCRKPGRSDYGYCLAHAKRLGLVPAEILKKHEENKKRAKTPEGQQEKLDKAFDAEKLYKTVTGDNRFSLWKLVQEIKDMGGQELEVEEFKKDLFISWWMADAQTRMPGTLDAACKVLGLKEVVARRWMNADWFAERLYDERKKRMQWLAPIVDRTNMILALRGNKDAIREFNALLGKIPEKKVEEDPFANVNKDLIEEAREDVLSDDNKTGTIRLTEDEKILEDSLVKEIGLHSKGDKNGE